MRLLSQVGMVGGMPVVESFAGTEARRWMGFNEAMSHGDGWCGVHFYVDDYQFERVWRQPERYAFVLSRFGCVTGPDFSLYIDAPEAVNRWNVYRNRLLTAYWQRCGLQVVPSVSWAGPESLCYALEGLPVGGIMAVGCVAVRHDKRLMGYWQEGVERLIDTCRPSRLLVYGREMKFAHGATEVVWIEDYVSRMRRRLSSREKMTLYET